jgi:3-oxoacyl-[acyl-carrier protein] reductase
MPTPPVGQKYCQDIRISRERVFEFARVSGDQNPIHLDEDAAREYGFSQPVCHGAILLAEISRIIGTELPGGGAFWTDVHLDFARPLYWDETVSIEVEVVQSSPSLNMVKLKFDISRGDTKVLGGTCRVLCLNKLKRRSSMPELKDRIALVTGGSRGLGLAVVRELLSAGYGVISLSRKKSQALTELKTQNSRLHTVYADLQQPVDLERQLLKPDIEGINVIVHAASPSPQNEKFQQDLYLQMQPFLAVYIDSLIRLVALALPYMKEKQYGRIITVGSSFTAGPPPPGMYSYVTAKEALWGVTKSLSVELGKFGITANMVSPSMMVTDMTSDISNMVKYTTAEGNPLKRLVEPGEVARTVAFLCGEASTFINGANIPITGGGR